MPIERPTNDEHKYNIRWMLKLSLIIGSIITRMIIISGFIIYICTDEQPYDNRSVLSYMFVSFFFIDGLVYLGSYILMKTKINIVLMILSWCFGASYIGALESNHTEILSFIVICSFIFIFLAFLRACLDVYKHYNTHPEDRFLW